jgi:EmrB/QacA subfamily drug resistance transporter
MVDVWPKSSSRRSTMRTLPRPGQEETTEQRYTDQGAPQPTQGDPRQPVAAEPPLADREAPGPGPGATAPDAPGWRRPVGGARLLLVVLSAQLALLLAALDQMIVGTAMPRIIADLNGFAHYAWVATAYLLAATVMVPIYGKLSDLYGRRPFFLGGMALFLLGSALSGASHSLTQLILCRALQGLGGGAIMPIVQAIVGDLFPPAERGKWQGLTLGVWGLASFLGPALGGWITDSWGWRWVFYVNMPVGAAALLVGAVTLPAGGERRSHRIDYPGAALLVAGTLPLLLAFSWAGTEYAWRSAPIVGLLAAAVALLGAFVLVEYRAAEPIIDPRLFANRAFAVAVAATFLVSAGLFGTLVYLPLFMQGVAGVDATSSGVVGTPIIVGVMISSVLGGQVVARTGRYKALVVAGLVIAALGMFLLSRMGLGTTQGVVVRNMVVTGLGIGLPMTLFTTIVQNAFPRRQLGVVTADLQFFREIGGTIGLALLGSVLTNRFPAALAANLPPSFTQQVPPDRLAALANPQILLSAEATAQLRQGFAAFGPQGASLYQQLMDAVRVSLASGIAAVFMAGVGLMLLGALAALFLRETLLRTRHDPAADGA